MRLFKKKEKSTGYAGGGRRRGFVAGLMCAAMVVNTCAFMLSSCAGRDELGNKYSDKTEGMAAADALVDSAKAVSDAVSDISYDIALMVQADFGKTVYDLGVKNSYFATDRGTEDSEIFCSKTYYGAEGNQVDVFYRHGGYLYIDFCNTMIRSEKCPAFAPTKAVCPASSAIRKCWWAPHPLCT